jgi:recombination endonuclease VII
MPDLRTKARSRAARPTGPFLDAGQKREAVLRPYAGGRGGAAGPPGAPLSDLHEPLGPADDQAAIDHCYHTGLVRGVLHPTCNAGLGHFCDDPERLRRAARYLEESQRRLNDADAKFIPAQRLGRRPET